MISGVYVDRYRISSSRSRELKINMYRLSAYLAQQNGNPAQGLGDAIFCKKLGGVIEIGDFFAKVANSNPSSYPPI